MAVFTPVTEDQARAHLRAYHIGDLVGLHPIAEGVENTNYRLETTAGLHVLTLFEGRTDAAGLPFCLGLTEHLADRGFPAPRPIRDHAGSCLGRLNGRPAAIIEWRPGDWLRTPSLADHRAAGVLLARLHLDAADYTAQRANAIGPAAWRVLVDRCAPVAKGADRVLLDRVETALAALGEPLAADLPRGAIHADYFPDNVLFDEGHPSGVIDVYFGCTDLLAYDLAIALCAWGFDADGRAVPEALRAFQAGYESLRPLTGRELQALPRLGQAAAVRFTLTRLHDRLFHDPSRLVSPKDPAAFLKRLDYWSGHAPDGTAQASNDVI